MIPETQNLDFLGFKKLISLLIGFLTGWKTVAATVQFNGKSGLGAIEIENVPIDGMLAAKFKFFKAPVPQKFPELGFVRCGFFTKALGLCRGFLGGCFSPPSPWSSPPPGERMEQCHNCLMRIDLTFISRQLGVSFMPLFSGGWYPFRRA